MHVIGAWTRWMIFGLILLSAAEVAAAGEGHVYKFVSARKLGANGRDHLVMIVQPPSGGPQIRLILPNSDRDRYSPKKEDADLVSGMQPGQFVQATSHLADGAMTIDSVASWSPRPGEETPHGYVYLTSGASDKNPADLQVALMKFGEPVNITVPGQPGADGTAAPDPAIAAELKQVEQGDVVWADVIPGKTPVLAAIVHWSEAQQGRLMRVGPADVDGQRGFAAEIATDTKPVTALIPLTTQKGKSSTDPRLLAAARKVGNGSQVLFRVREDGEKTWLLEIEPPAKEPPVAQRREGNAPPAGIPVHSVGGAGSVPGIGGGVPGGF